MSTTMTKVATFALPIVVLDFGDGDFGYEIGVNGALNFDSEFKSFDEAEGAARKAAEFLEQQVLAGYAGAASTIEASQADGQLPDAVRVPRDVYEAVLNRLDYTAKFIPSGDIHDVVVREHERLKMCAPTTERE